MNPITKATAVPINAIGNQGNNSHFHSKKKNRVVGIVAINSKTKISLLVHSITSLNVYPLPVCMSSDSYQPGVYTSYAFYPDGTTVYWIGNVHAAVRLNTTKAVGLADHSANTLSVSANIPNPANESTIVHYSLSESSLIAVDVYDVTGKRVMTALNEFVSAGQHTLTIPLGSLETGVYFYTFKTNATQITRKMTVMKN